MLRNSISAVILFIAATFLLPDRYLAAAELQVVGPDTRVSADTTLTYTDLARHVVPGLANTPADARAFAGIRHLGGADLADLPADPVISSVTRLDILCDGKPAMLVLYDYGIAEGSAQSVSLLALFDMTGTPRFLDVMDVGLDRETFFIEPLSFAPIGNNMGVLFLRNSHHNAGEEFVQSSILAIWGGKMHEVDTIGSMSWDAGVARIRTTLSFAPVVGASAIDAIADVNVEGCDDECDASEKAKLPKPERLTVRYLWDAGKKTFVAQSKAFDRLSFPDMEE